MFGMACPYFIPTERLAGGAWPHPSRLPLGAGFSGHCGANGTTQAVDDARLHDCNLGYARGCPHLPDERPWDAVRFGIITDRDGTLRVCYICETACRPTDHGTLSYELATARWTAEHRDAGLQRLAECYVASYLLRRTATER